MTMPGNQVPDNPVADDLDTLLTQARTLSPDDEGAAERFLARFRAAPRPAPKRAAWWPTLLASAAVVVGLLALRPAPALPASAAYDAYQSAWGEGW
ncbi:hypothetical protein [Deinococcus arcticus]|uniref:Uncharacterized protein n=1 Tax=Deinococcus arcticus TaxID=2136176 RepID=A0A2T3WAA8_9DEIO|nr:hypothetical protein [Deinococcus arcticus]PTA68848.1 hypothetical protein C8263_06390 [Deinococcus arcticus]